MAPLPTPPAATHVIHAKADTHAAKKTARRATPKRSRAPKLHPRKNTRLAKKVVRTTSAYRVRPGENLTWIAARNHVSLSTLIKLNRISDPDRLLSGSVLRIPHRLAPHTETASKTRKSRHTAKKHRLTPAQRRAAARKSARVTKARADLAKEHIPSRSRTKSLIESTARRYGVNPHLALGIAWQESGWNQGVVSPAGAIGAMQVMPQSGEWASGMVGRRLDLMKSRDNVTAGVAILRYLTSNAKDLDEAIGGYYQGLGAMRAHGPYADTLQYIRNVRALMGRL